MNGLGGEVLRYVLVGGFAFAIDSAVTMGLSLGERVPPPLAKAFAFGVAALVTFPLHWRFTFRKPGPMRGLGRYLAIGASGAVVNVAVFAIWLWMFGTSARALFMGIVVASGAALAFNFLMQKHAVFGAGR